MAPFVRSHMTSNWSVIVSIALSRTIFELFDIEECHKLERSLKITANYSIWNSTVTMALSCTVSEMKPDTGQNDDFSYPTCIQCPNKGDTIGISP